MKQIGASFIPITAVFAALVLMACSYPGAGSGSGSGGGAGAGGYKLVFEDEFTGSSLDTKVWHYDTAGNSQGWGNNELQAYTKPPAVSATGNENILVKDGVLKIMARHASPKVENKDYTSARIHTQGNKFFRYGRIEARIKVPNDPGVWPAFWLLGENFDNWGNNDYDGNVPWPSTGEIDIMEYSGPNALRTIGAIHWGKGNTNTHAFKTGYRGFTSSSSPSSEYHIYSITWTSSSVTWSVDGTAFFTLDIQASEFSEFRNPMFILLNLAVGGSLGGTPTPASYPQTMEVDWVRVYQEN